MANGLIFTVSPSKEPSETNAAGANQPRLVQEYKNNRQDAKRPYLTLSAYNDVSFYNGSQNSDNLSQPQTTGPQTMDASTSKDVRPYEKIQTFEGAREVAADAGRAPTIVCIAMEPGALEAEEKDFEDWYRRQHLDMMSMVRGYRRGTRYRRLDGVSPRYLAIHEYDCEPSELPADQIVITTRTEWSRKILEEAQIFDREVFTLTSSAREPGIL